VIDLIRKVRGVGFSEACRIAFEELAPQVGDWKPAETLASTRPVSSEALERVLADLGPMDAADLRVLLRFMDSKGMGGKELAQFAVEEWGWRGKFPALVVMPHRDWNGRLTGIKYRSAVGRSRWSEPGSSFPVLYGAWRDRGHAKVLITEGEGDAVFAAFELRDRRIDVLGLVSAAQTPTEQIKQRLAGRTVFVAGDGDEAGARANQQWIQAGIARHVVQLPEGEDVLSCGIPVRELIERADKR
jgi:hypothetical protein